MFRVISSGTVVKGFGSGSKGPRFNITKVPTLQRTIDVKHCSMFIPNQYKQTTTQTNDPNSIIEVIGSYRVHSDVQKSNAHVVSITMSKYHAKSFANFNRI